MPIAAVPTYLGTDFKDASPGLRFGMLLPIWTSPKDQEAEVKKRAGAKPLPGRWDKNDFAAKRAWEAIKTLTPSDRGRMKHLALRQTAFAATVSADRRLCLDALAISPFTTGLGNEHPLENGFAFLNPYGLPYLPGSGVKGVLRQAAQELASGEWGDTKGWSKDKCYTLAVGEDYIPLSVIDVLFGLESKEGEKQHIRGALSFWDVIPQIAGDSLMVEVMTPHQSHYYQQKSQAGSTTPHDSGQPNPICFLTVPPGSRFTFHVVCDEQHLRRLTKERATNAPDLLDDGATRWKTLLEAAFQHAFQWLGFGAKTAVGYGAMRFVSAIGERRPAHAGSEGEASCAQTVGTAAGGATALKVSEELWEKATLTWDPGARVLRALRPSGGRPAELRGRAAEDFVRTLSEAQRKQLVERRKELVNVRVVVEISGNQIVLKRLA